MIYQYNPDKLDELLAELEEGDFVQLRSEDFLKMIGNSGKAKGRKPISFDREHFIEVVAKWQAGELTARAAMQEVNLKPNTFYRRVKEISEMTDMKAIKKAIKEETKDFKDAFKEERKEIKQQLKDEKADMKDYADQVKAEAKELKKELKKQLKSEAREAEEKISETISAKKMEKEIFKEKLEAELEHSKEVKALEKEVLAEVEDFKSL